MNKTLKIVKGMSSVTKKVIRDYCRLSDKEFFAKYYCSKKTYYKRVKKYGDPYLHRINSKSYKLIKWFNEVYANDWCKKRIR